MKAARRITRRAVLIIGAIGTSGVLAFGSWRRWTDLREPIPTEIGDDATTTVDEHVTATLAAFLGASFGVPLSNRDRDELAKRFQFAVEHEPEWREAYGYFAQHLDHQTAESGGRTFIDASDEIQLSIAEFVLGRRGNSRRERLRAFFRTDGRSYILMKRRTIPQLLRLYRKSGVPWRRRGYETWPGVAGDRLAYTRPPGPGSC